MKDRLLNILIASFVFLLLLNIFLPKPEQAAVQTEPNFTLSQSSVVVPNFPKVSFNNTTDTEIRFDTCRDLTILSDLRTLKYDESTRGFCREIIAAPKSAVAIDIAPLAPLFTKPGNLGLKLVLPSSGGSPSREITSSILVEERGFWRSLMATLFYAPVLNAFIALIEYLPGHSLGLAIIAITIIVRIILLVPQHQMLVSARKMQAIQPKIAALQAKYKWDQAKMGSELMGLYKREKVNPLGSCLPLLIQTPILIVLYWVLTSIQDHSNVYYFYSFFKDFDITRIEHIFYGVDLLKIGGWIGAALAVIVGVTQFAQIWLSQRGKPAVSTADRDPNSLMPDPNLMNKFMLYGMPLMIGVSTLYFPYGVGMYWFIWTLFMLVQQQIANQFADASSSGVESEGEVIAAQSTLKSEKKGSKKSKVVIEG
jgi:YidC/Oxa1 family membrane protein insertase